MANNKGVYGVHFCGNEISDYGKAHGFVDYRTFAKAFDCVLNNDIFSKAWDLGEWELVNGYEDEDSEAESCEEVFQWFIVSEQGAEIIQEYTNEILYYHDELGIYLWGVTHFGTSWDYVLTDIPCNTGKI